MDRLLLLALLLTACAEQRETEALIVLLDSAPESLDPYFFTASFVCFSSKAFIESDTVLYLDRSFTAAVSAGTTAAIDELGINFAEDFILGEVLYNGNLSAGQRYNFVPEFTKSDLLADNSRAVIATPNVMSLMYGSDGAIKTDFDSITLKVQTVGFEAPKIVFKFLTPNKSHKSHKYKG